MSSTTLPVCPKTGSTSPSLTVHLCLHTAPGNRECALTAFNLRSGLLIYAGTSRPTAHVVRHAGKRLEVVSIDLSGSLSDTLAFLRNKVAARILHPSGGGGRGDPRTGISDGLLQRGA